MQVVGKWDDACLRILCAHVFYQAYLREIFYADALIANVRVHSLTRFLGELCQVLRSPSVVREMDEASQAPPRPQRWPKRSRILLRAALLCLMSSGVVRSGPSSAGGPCLHGDQHPAVTVNQPALTSAHAGSGSMELSFVLQGLCPGFSYRVLVQQKHGENGAVHQQQESLFSFDSTSDRQVTVSLAKRCLGEESNLQVSIGVWDAEPGLPSVEALVARRDLTFTIHHLPASFWASQGCRSAGEQAVCASDSDGRSSASADADVAANAMRAACRGAGGADVPDGWTVLVSVSEGFADMFENWLYFYQLLGLDMPVLLVAEDQTTFDRYSSRQHITVLAGSFQPGAGLGPLAYASVAYKALVSMRPTYILQALCKHGKVIYSDVDTGKTHTLRVHKSVWRPETMT